MLVFTACLLLFSLPFVAFACLRKRPTVARLVGSCHNLHRGASPVRLQSYGSGEV
jgi:hypothetical protein